MSLENAINDLNENVKLLITVLQTGLKADETLENKKTVYWLIEKHNTVYEQKPGDIAPSIEGAVQVTKKVYDAKKSEFAALTKTVTDKSAATQVAAADTPRTAGAAAETAAPEKTGGASSPTAASAAVEQQASTAATDVPFTAVVERFTELNKSTKPGHGRDGLMKVLSKWLPNDEKPSVTKLQPLGKNAEILADVDALLNAGTAEAEYDPLA